METELFKYTDYRSFLREHADRCRSQKKNWSLGLWARKLNLQGTSSLTMVLNGQRYPGTKMVHKFVKYFGFGEKEASYFCGLVNLAKMKGQPEVATILRERLQQLNPRAKTQFFDDKQFSALSSWQYYTIREMSRLKGFNPSPEWIIKRLKFKITKKEVERTIQNLKTLQLISSSEDGSFKSTDQTLNTNPDVENAAVRKYQTQLLEFAKESLEKTEIKERDFSTLTMNINGEDLVRMKKCIQEFLDTLQHEFESDDGNATYQVQMQVFPFTKPFIN